MSKKQKNDTSEVRVVVSKHIQTKDGNRIKFTRKLKIRPDGSIDIGEQILKPNTWKFVKKIKTITTNIKWEEE